MVPIKRDKHLAGVAQWTEHGLRTKGSQVRFPVRAHAWVADQVPGWGHAGGNQLMYLSHRCFSPSLSLFSPLKINKIFFKKIIKSSKLGLQTDLRQKQGTVDEKNGGFYGQ